jgi:hypothetical protein
MVLGLWAIFTGVISLVGWTWILWASLQEEQPK